MQFVELLLLSLEVVFQLDVACRLIETELVLRVIVGRSRSVGRP